jgi:hypothetical protein
MRVNKKTPQQPRSAQEAYSNWIYNGMKLRTYDEALEAGVEAFLKTGKHVTKNQVRKCFPRNDESIAGLIFFIWDVTKNNMEATIRLRSI